MKTEFIFNFLSGQDIPMEEFYSHINFDEGSGSFIKNNVYKNKTQFGIDSSGEFLFNEYHPALFSSCYKYNNYTGSGLFDSNNALYLNKAVKNENFTIFIHQKNIISNNLKDKSKILLDYVSSGDQDQFSYSIGLTEKNNFLIEFSGTKSGIVESKKSFLENLSPFNNIIALQIKDGTINFYQFDINANIFTYNSLVNKNDYNHLTKNIYVGNKYQFIKNYHTGFSGILKDIIIIDRILDENQLLDLSKTIAQTGEAYSGISLYQDSYKIYYSGKINPTGILGTGIVRYDRILDQSFNLNCQNHNSCRVYTLSGITGLITGNKIEYEAEENVEPIYISGKKLAKYDQDLINSYSNLNIKELLSENSIYEIQTYDRNLNSEIKSGFYINNLPSSSDWFFYEGKMIKSFVSGVSGYTISGANEYLVVSNTQNKTVDGKYVPSGLYTYGLSAGGIPLLSNRKTLYTSLRSNSFIRWTNISGWTFVKNNLPIYGSYEDTQTPAEVINWFSYYNYNIFPKIEKSSGQTLSINNFSNINSIFNSYSVESMSANNQIDLSSFARYSIYLNGIKLIENKDYFALNNSIIFKNSILSGNLFISQDLYTNKITGDINSIFINSKIYPDKHLLWVDGLLKIEGIDYWNNKLNLQGGYFNNIKQNNIQILIR